MLQKSTESFTTQQKVKKSQFHSRNWGNVPSAVKTRNKPSLQRHSLDFGLNVYTQTVSGKIGPWSPFCESASPNFLLRKSLD